MSDRPRRALADDEEPEEIPEVRFVEEGAIPARRAAGNCEDGPIRRVHGAPTDS